MSFDPSEIHQRDEDDGPTLSLLAGMDDAPDCPECENEMAESITYSKTLKERVPSWTCDECGRAVYREV